MGFINQFPYSDFHEMNLDWIIRTVKNIEQEMQGFKAVNEITYAGEWNISKQYSPWDIVTDSGYGYIAIKPVPSGIQISNTNYWSVIADVTVDSEARQEIQEILYSLVNIVESGSTASAARAVGDYVIVSGKLYIVIRAISSGAAYTEGYNIEATTIEDLVKAMIPAVDTVFSNTSLNAIANKPVSEEFNTVNNNIRSIASEVNNIKADTSKLKDELQTESNDRTKADNVLSARIDSIASLPEGSTSGDAELMDIRIGADGAVYDTAGDAVRDQVEVLNKAVFDLTTYDWTTSATTSYPEGWRKGYIDPDGASQSSNVYIRTNFIYSRYLKGKTRITLIPPEGYWAWANVFINDTVSTANLVGQYKLTADRVADQVVDFPLEEGQGLVICIGRFDGGDAGDYIHDSTFLNSCQMKLWSPKADEFVSPYKGKKFSLLGSSVSAYASEIPAGNRAYYDGTNAGVSSPDQMYYNVMADILGMEKLVINGWSGSCVASGIRNDSTYVPSSDPSRCEALNDGATDPDIILIAMGSNDYTYDDDADEFGSWDGTTALGEQADMSDYDTSDFHKAYGTMLARLKMTYPDAQIYCITPFYSSRRTTDTGCTYLNAIDKQLSDYAEAIKKIAAIFNVHVLDGLDIGFNRYNYYPTYAQDSSTTPTHPNALGHKIIGEALAKQMLNLYVI